MPNSREESRPVGNTRASVVKFVLFILFIHFLVVVVVFQQLRIDVRLTLLTVSSISYWPSPIIYQTSNCFNNFSIEALAQLISQDNKILLIFLIFTFVRGDSNKQKNEEHATTCKMCVRFSSCYSFKNLGVYSRWKNNHYLQYRNKIHSLFISHSIYYDFAKYFKKKKKKKKYTRELFSFFDKLSVSLRASIFPI